MLNSSYTKAVDGVKTVSSPNDRVYRIESMFPEIINLEDFPTEILLSIFATLDDLELFHVAISSHRFEPIAQTVFEQRYRNKYFVINGAFKRGTYQQLIKHFGGCIRAFEFRDLHNIDKNHWAVRLLNGFQTQKLYFVNCDFENVKNALSRHKHITHLAFRGGCAYGFARLSGFHNLKEFTMYHFDGIYYTECKQVIMENRQLEHIEIVDDSFYNPLEMIECASQYSKHLNQLRVVNEAMPLQMPSDDVMNDMLDLTKRLVSLGISTDNQSFQLLQRLSLSCENIKRLALFHVDHTLENRMIDVIGSFGRIESLSLVLKTYEEGIVSIVKKLPNLLHLSVTYRCRTPSSNNYILSLLRECTSLEEIIVDTHQDKFKPKQPKLNEEFHGEFNEVTLNRPKIVRLELKEEGKSIAIVSNKAANRSTS